MNVSVCVKCEVRVPLHERTNKHDDDNVRTYRALLGAQVNMTWSDTDCWICSVVHVPMG